jgi:hypothetical protein
MRTGLFLVAGFLLLGGSLIVGKLFSTIYPTATTAATVLFLAVWLAIAAVNMWLGVAKAGYSVSVEFPIFALIFAVPAAAAVLVRWKLL